MRFDRETEFANGVAAMSACGACGQCRVAAGIVGFADLTLGAAVGEVLHALECFGVQRCMFESNFPVGKVSCSCSVLWSSFKRIAADFSANEKAALFHDTAADFYRR